MTARLCILTLCLTLAACLSAAADDGLELFEKKIRPVLIEHCYECHSGESTKLRGALRADLRDGLRRGGESGDPAVVPGEPEEGTLLAALRHETFEMPPQGRLPAAVIADFQRWIRLGAPDPRDGRLADSGPREIDIEAARQQWAFRPPAKTPPPQLDGDPWPQSDIDRFIRAAQRDRGLTPAADAGRGVLLRRVCYDLTGLPPTAEQLREFLEDDSPQALERTVDRLLQSREFAERWGRHWLDVARFAESSGGGRSLMFPEAWRYRDYVIESFQQDKPFDVFLTEQIAGDLMHSDTQQQADQRIVAAGYLILGAINYELQDKELLEMEVIDEQLEAIGRGFMGLTLGCARCHDHKFDPVPTRDYYQLAAVLASTRSITPGNVSGYVTRSLGGPEALRRHERHKRQVDEAAKRLKSAEKKLAELRDASSVLVDTDQARLEGEWTVSQALSHVGENYVHDDFQGKGRKSATFAARLPRAGKYEVLFSYNTDPRRAPRVPVRVRHAEGEQLVHLNQQQKPEDGQYTSLGAFPFDRQGGEVRVSNEGTEGFVVIADAVKWTAVEDTAVEDTAAADTTAADAAAADAADEQARRDELQAARREIAELRRQLKLLKQSPPPPPQKAMTVVDVDQPRDNHIRVRGQVRSLGAEVPRGFLSVVDVDEPQLRIPDDQSGRLQLARWLVSPQHPLTARVMANRVWQHLIGEGIVRTVDNFGTMGEPPTHPELLDYLAVTFREDGWSVKRLVRRIVLSRTYRLSSEASERQLAADPENRWLARAHRRRLDAEAIRDTMLQAAGTLQPHSGGRTIRKLAQYDLGYEFGEVNLRSVYVPAFRNARLDLFAVFDAPNPNLVSGRRTVSTLPTQALYLLNSPFVRRQAERAAERLLQIEDREERVEQAFLRLLGRPPRSDEVEWSQQVAPGAEAADWSRLVQLLMASVDFRYLY